jgi:uncharacterized protein (DUF1501 family)
MVQLHTRRKFVKNALLGTCGAAIHQVMSPLNSGFMAWADPVPRAFSSSPILILVNLAGGASYNVAPLYDGTYRDKNPTVSYGPDSSLALSADQGLHPSLLTFKSAWDEGNLALLNMVGYPNPNRSHAESTDIWFKGIRNGNGDQSGWAARMTCQLGNLFAGVSLGGSRLLVQGDCNPPRAFEGLASLGENDLHGSDIGEWLRMTRANMMVDHIPPSNGNFAFVKQQMDNLQASLDLVKKETAITLPTIQNPFPQNMSGFQRSCRDAALLSAARSLSVRFIYLERGGFDTHANEKPSLTGNLNDINTGLRSLVQTLKALDRWRDTVIVTMSEFCRTFENGSAGTDHGHAAPLFVMGGAVKGGIKSPVPSAAQTRQREYYHDYSVDFRQVFKEVVGNMGLNADAIFPEQISFSNLGLF